MMMQQNYWCATCSVLQNAPKRTKTHQNAPIRRMLLIISIAEASVMVGKPRSTLYRAGKKGRLSITKLPNGVKGVDTSELFRIFPKVVQSGAKSGALHVAKVVHSGAENADTTDHEKVYLRKEVVRLENQTKMLSTQIERLEKQNDNLFLLFQSRLISAPKKKKKSKKKKRK